MPVASKRSSRNLGAPGSVGGPHASASDIPFRIYTKDINKQNIKFLCTKMFIMELFVIEKDWRETKCP